MPTLSIGRNAEMRMNNESSWAAARGASTAEVVRVTSTTATTVARESGGAYWVWRNFFAIDTSSYTHMPMHGASGTILRVYGVTFNSGNVIVVKVSAGATGDSSTNFVAADFNNITAVSYSDPISTWNKDDWNDIVLNNDALSDIARLDEFKFAIMDYTYDYLNSAPSGVLIRNGMNMLDASSNTPRCNLIAGYPNRPRGKGGGRGYVTRKINGIPMSSVSKIYGV
tara:strand:- start:45 stop:722 length:678 start_codon:yes stop_codon:yes gene_type:complete